MVSGTSSGTIIEPIGDRYIDEITADDLKMLMVPVSKMSRGLYGTVNMLLKCVFYSAVESDVINLQRSTILPSEKAFSYKMRLEAMNRQGQRTDLTSVPVAQKSTSREQLGKEVGESQDQVRRYIRLTQLIQPLLDLVDEGRIAFRPAVELSYLKKEEQEDLLEEISYADATPSLAQAIKMKRFSQEGKLSNEVIESIMSEEKPNQKEKIRIKYEDARRFIPDSVPYNKTGEYIMKALEYYHRVQERQKDRGEAR